MCGAPGEPIPGRYSQHIPADVADNGERMGANSENDDEREE